MTEIRKPFIDRLALSSPEAKNVVTPYGYVLIELLQLYPGNIVPIFNKLPTQTNWKKSQPQESNEGWGSRGLQRTGQTLRDPVKTTYVQEFKKQHAASIRRVLKPSDSSIKQL